MAVTTYSYLNPQLHTKRRNHVRVSLCFQRGSLFCPSRFYDLILAGMSIFEILYFEVVNVHTALNNSYFLHCSCVSVTNVNNL